MSRDRWLIFNSCKNLLFFYNSVNFFCFSFYFLYLHCFFETIYCKFLNSFLFTSIINLADWMSFVEVLNNSISPDWYVFLFWWLRLFFVFHLRLKVPLITRLNCHQYCSWLLIFVWRRLLTIWVTGSGFQVQRSSLIKVQLFFLAFLLLFQKGVSWHTVLFVGSNRGRN